MSILSVLSRLFSVRFVFVNWGDAVGPNIQSSNKRQGGVSLWMALVLIIIVQTFAAADAHAVLRPPLTDAEMKALPTAELARLRWLQQYQLNVLLKSGDDLKTTVANVEKAHDCIQFGIDMLSLSFDIKAGYENIAKTRARYAEAVHYLDDGFWLDAGKRYKGLANSQAGLTVLFSLGFLIDSMGTKVATCFGGDNTVITKMISATGAQETAEFLKEILSSAQNDFVINTTLTVVLDTLKGVEFDPSFFGFPRYGDSPIFLALLNKKFSSLKVSPPKWDYFLTKGLQFTNDVFFAGVLAPERKEADSIRVALEFLERFYGRYKGNLDMFCQDIAFGPNCTQGTIEQLFYAYLNTPESNGVSTSDVYNSFTVKDRYFLGSAFFDGLSEEWALARIRNALLQGPLLFDIKITTPAGAPLNDTNLTGGTRSFILKLSLNSLADREYGMGASSTECKLNIGTGVPFNCYWGIDRPGNVNMLFKVDLSSSSGTIIPIELPMYFPVVASAADMSSPFWIDDKTAILQPDEYGIFNASYAIRAPKVLHKPSGQQYSLVAGDTYAAWVQNGGARVTSDVNHPNADGTLNLAFSITPEDRANASTFTAYLSATTHYSDGEIPVGNAKILIDKTALASLENVTPYLRVFHPDTNAADYYATDRSFTAKANDKITLYLKNTTPTDFSSYTGDLTVYLGKPSGSACPGNVPERECVINNTVLGRTDAVKLRSDGGIDLIIPVDGRFQVYAVADRT